MKRFFLTAILFLILVSAFAIQPDTLRIRHTTKAPCFDGKSGDKVWDNAEWIAIDQVWMPWGEKLSADDYTGRFKVLWSSKANLLYFVAEIIDDTFVDGYIFGGDNHRNNSEYDIFEVFIDPNNSGGLHVFDATGKDGEMWGVNAENAFTYHISVNAPKNKRQTRKKTVQDIAGTDWNDIRNYADHLPDFAFRKNSNIYTYEFSLKVYKDSFDPNKPSENDRDLLHEGKIMGLATAYCDSDDKAGEPLRKSFIGSVPGDAKMVEWEPTKQKYIFNQTWKNADYFGKVILIK